MKITKDMALTRKAFFDTLPRALDSTVYSVDGDTVTLTGEGRQLTITFAERPTMKLGGFSVPRADVTLEFSGYDTAEAEEALKRFQRYFHRGGG